MERRQVTVRVPATTANLGPGFDCLGIALELWNSVRIEVSTSPKVRILGQGSFTLSPAVDNLVYRSAQALFREAGEDPQPLSILCTNQIPLARGLGSSAAAIVGGLMAANELSSQPLTQQCLLHLAVSLEGHADNVTPALLGGCQVVVRDGDSVISDTVPLPPDLTTIIFVPDAPMSTQEARSILPRTVSREDAVYNLGRVALLVNALSSGHLENLRVATQDQLHQPARENIFPAMKYVFRSALDAGALGVFLSGGGSSIMALATSRAMTIGYEMANAADKVGVPGDLKIIRPSLQGAHIVPAE